MVSKNELLSFSPTFLLERNISTTPAAVDHFHFLPFLLYRLLRDWYGRARLLSFVMSLSPPPKWVKSLKDKDKDKHVMNCSIPSSIRVKSFYAMIEQRLNRKEVNLLFEII